MTVIDVTKENFQVEIMESDKPVLIDFFAPWCGPCRMLSPIIDEIAQEADSFKVAKVNVDEQPELAQAFGVMSIPTLVVMKDGKVVDKAVGARPKAAIMAMVEQQLSV
ncbi:MAG: thioredoxin [Eubacteriales bacterium]|jgi:thioredoxin 1|nr:thioredoxin [Clostridiales bacterium]